jgi:hypothetical protein
MAENEPDFQKELEALEREVDRTLKQGDQQYERRMEDAVNDFIKQHKGKAAVVTYYGGPYHMEEKLLRRPYRQMMEVAGPPIEQSPGIYTFEWEYFTYYFKETKDEHGKPKIWYVEENSLVDFTNEYQVK